MIFQRFLKLRILFFCFNLCVSGFVCFAQELITDIAKFSFVPLRENESLEWDYYYSDNSGEVDYTVPYVLDQVDDRSVVIYKKKSDNSKEEIVAFETKEIQKINNNKIYFFHYPDFAKHNNGEDKNLYAIDGIAGCIKNLNINAENALSYSLCVSTDEKYVCYAKFDNWNVSNDIPIPFIEMINIRTGERKRFDFKDTFLRGFSIVQNDDIRIMYMKNRFYIEFLESEIQANCFDGYIDLFDMQFYLTLGNPNGYKNPPLDLTNFVKTHISLDNLNLRSWISIRYKNIIYTVPKGEFVQVLKTEKYNDSIDGISAPWVKVLTEDGHTGWCFSGYLEPVDLTKE